MASIIPGYEYDIFISYRQKDNKHDGWVTEFVDNLKGELESTFKEEISVYFDINPHDGLLETHDVDASLKEKLKCLIFIPIISRTYYDPKSFAWEHEFKAFVELASKDQFGLKVKLSNGNVANRILPIQIHEITADDKAHIEKELRGVLRAIEFIYKEPGVNKPLTANDDEKLNLNKTKYRIQINKVANAIDEVINSLKNFQLAPLKFQPQQMASSLEVRKVEREEIYKKSSKLNTNKILSGAAIMAILIIIAILFYPKIFKTNTLEDLRAKQKISVAVVPFQNMTNDSTIDFWQKMIQDNLITNLSNSPEELTVRQTESISSLIQSKGLANYSSITPSFASNIAQKLDANVFVYGSINQSGTTLRLNAQLMDTKTEAIFKSFKVEGTVKKILPIIDSLSVMIKNYILISMLNREITPDFQNQISTNSLEAYRYFYYGDRAMGKSDYPAAINWYLQAIDIDSNFVYAAAQIAMAYSYLGMYEQSKQWCLRNYKKRDLMPIKEKINTFWQYAFFFETPNEQIRYIKQAIDLDGGLLTADYMLLANAYMEMYQYDKAIPVWEKALEIYKKWDSKPFFVYYYTSLGLSYHKTKQYKKEKKLYKKAEKDFPDFPDLFYMQASLSLTERDTISAIKYINKYRSALQELSWSEASVSSNLAYLYFQNGMLKNAEKYYRQTLFLEPENPVRLNKFAYFLIDSDRNINEGLELVDKALESNQNDYNYLHTKGWGLYKQGNYNEALEILKKSWDLRMKNARYDHSAFLHLEEAKKAVANQK